jgi:pimeloyl-ACP methyl ester carboxylesterase
MSTLVLLHAFPLDHRMYDDIVEPIAQSGWQVFAPDIRGFGEAPSWENKPQSLTTCAQDVVAMLDKYGITKAVIGGCSLGGYIAMEMLRYAPERVAGLILMDTKASADSEEGRANRYRVAESVFQAGTTEAFWRSMLPNLLGATTSTTKPHTVDRVRGILSESKVEAVMRLQEAMAARPDSHADLRAFHGPVLSLRGVEDVIATAADHAQMVEAAPDAIHVDIKGAGHLAPIEAPAETADAIVDFLYRVSTQFQCA